jgi:hypothetical protein
VIPSRRDSMKPNVGSVQSPQIRTVVNVSHVDNRTGASLCRRKNRQLSFRAPVAEARNAVKNFQGRGPAARTRRWCKRKSNARSMKERTYRVLRLDLLVVTLKVTLKLPVAGL